MRTIVILMLVLMTASVSGARINEVMYNPAGTDADKEYVEVIGTSNLTNYTIGDNFGNDTLSLAKFVMGNYSLIVPENYNYTKINSSVYTVSGSIGNGLSNSGDTIYLYYNGTLIDNMNYSGSLGDNNGKSLEYYNESWVESLNNGTPGYVNSHETFSIENSNLTENSTNQTNICNISISLDVEDKIYSNGDKVEYYNTLNDESHDYIIEYGVTDLFGNEERPVRNTTNTDKKQFTPKPDYPAMAYVIKNRLVNVSCNNVAEKTSSEAVVMVKGNENSCSETVICQDLKQDISKLELDLKKEKSKRNSGGGGGAYFAPKKEPEIASFYTRKRKHSSKITLFSRIEGEGLLFLKLTSRLETFNKTILLNESDTIELEVLAEQGRNIYALELSDSKKELDVETLVVEFAEEQEEEVVEETAAAPPKKENNTVKTVAVVREETPEVTANVIYDETENAASYLVTGSLLLSLVLIGYSAWNYFNERPEEIQEIIENY